MMTLAAGYGSGTHLHKESVVRDLRAFETPLNHVRDLMGLNNADVN